AGARALHRLLGEAEREMARGIGACDPMMRSQASRAGRRSQAKLWVAVGIAIAVVATAWLAYSYRQSDAAASAAPAALPKVVVSKPLEREVDSRLGFLGQFSAVEQVEL